ncbi:MAG: diguanylate cyclase [Gammaproteobacteria bacterium]|nr:diguanylate cyclase [Gammaproteobacteria bacterium]
MKNGEVFVSRVFQGRDLGRDPIVAISAPLLGRDNERLGIIEGSLNLRAFSRIDYRRVQSDASEMILVDQDNRVIYASPSAGFTTLESITADPLIGSATGTAAGYEYTAGTPSKTHQFLAASAGTETGWTVYFRAPLTQISQQMLGDYLVGALALLGACILSLLLAGVIVRQVTRTVDDMNKAVASFRLDGSEDRVQTPPNTPAEFRPIFKHMRKRSAQLRRTHKRLSNSIKAGERLQKELTQSIALKEVEVAERTAELEEANEKLSSLSKIDALTGIPNRREYDAFAERIWKVGAREKTAVAVIMLDIDYFKPYNDSLGHQAGDDCLVQVARALKSCATRPLDLVARYGGEEFIAILGGAKIDDALIVAQRMRNAVFNLQIPHPASAHHVVTVSIGVASSIPIPSSEPTQAVKAADEALYEAKAAGRNAVVYLQGHQFHLHSNATPHQETSSVVPLRS